MNFESLRDDILTRNREIIQTNLAALDGFFTRYSKYFTWTRPTAGSTAFIRFTHPSLSVSELAAHLVAKNGVLILPDEVYGDLGVPREVSSGFWRLGFGRRNMIEVLKVMEEFLEKNI